MIKFYEINLFNQYYLFSLIRFPDAVDKIEMELAKIKKLLPLNLNQDKKHVNIQVNTEKVNTELPHWKKRGVGKVNFI